MNQNKWLTTNEKVQLVSLAVALSGLITFIFSIILAFIYSTVLDIVAGLRDWHNNSGMVGPAVFFGAILIPAIALMVFMVIYSRKRFREMFSTVNGNFWKIPAEAKVGRLKWRVENMELSESARVKFTGEIDKINAILSEEIPTLIGKIHAQASDYSEKVIDYKAEVLDGALENNPVARQLHYRWMVLSTFYYNACNQLTVMGSKTVISLEDIDNELSDIIDAWGKIEKE